MNEWNKPDAIIIISKLCKNNSFGQTLSYSDYGSVTIQRSLTIFSLITCLIVGICRNSCMKSYRNIRLASGRSYATVFVSMLNFFMMQCLNRNRKLGISTAPTKAKSRESACSLALIKNKIDRQRVRSRESGRQTIRRLWCMYGVWNWDGEGSIGRREYYVIGAIV